MLLKRRYRKNNIGNCIFKLPSTITERKNNRIRFDFQKSFYNKWKEDEFLDIPKLYDVEVISDNENPFSDLETLMELKESEDINILTWQEL